MIKAVEAYKLTCDGIMELKDHQIDPVSYTVDAIEFCIKREAKNGLQHTFYGIDLLNDYQIKEVLKTVRNEGYMVRRDNKVLEISW